jgi:3-hydroxyisobutyryl-CoA hydrolase
MLSSRPLLQYLSKEYFHCKRLFCKHRSYAPDQAEKAAIAERNEVIFTEINTAGVITLNRPPSLNALNLSMAKKIYSRLKEWNDSSSISHVIIEGAGGKAFCAGGDIVAVSKAGKAGDLLAQNFFREEYRLNHLIGDLKKPYIALLDGFTMGGGVGLSVHGSHRVGSEKCVFAMPETGIGLFPDVGGGYFLPKLRGQLGLYVALVGIRLHGADVLSAGVATHFVESAKHSELKEVLAHEKNLVHEDVNRILKQFCPEKPLPEFSLSRYLEAIDRHFRFNHMEDIIHSLEKDNSDWCRAQIATLRKMSPTSLKITLKQLRESVAKRMNMTEVLTMEYRMSQRCMATNHDFHEGVRALLVDKDKSPKWNPPTLEEVSEELVDSHFAPFDDPKLEWQL